MTAVYRERSLTRPLTAIKLARGVLFVATTASLAAQCIISLDSTNIMCSFLAAIQMLVAISYCLRARVVNSYPISTLMLLGVSTCTAGGALISQSMYLHPIAFNLQSPTKTFSICLTLMLTATLSHFIYSSSTLLLSIRLFLTRNIYNRIGLFTPPDTLALWVMGIVGLTATAVAGTSEATANIGFGDVRGKILQGLIPLAGAPFLAPFSDKLFGSPNTGHPMKHVWPLAAYLGVLTIVALATNSRGTFSIVILMVLLCLIMGLLLGKINISRKFVLPGFIAILLLIPTVQELTKLSTAMIIARADRSDLDPLSLAQRTIVISQNDELLNLRKTRDLVVTNSYNEIYIPNVFLSRLIVLKFIDLNLTHIRNLSSDQRDEARATGIQRALAGIPTPILSIFGISVNKDNLRFSSGDLYRFFASGGALGDYTSGSSVADGLALFGWAFWLLAPLYFISLFVLADALSVKSTQLGTILSGFAGLQIGFFATQALVAESIAGQLVTLVRSVPQNAAFYLLILLACRIFERSLLVRK